MPGGKLFIGTVVSKLDTKTLTYNCVEGFSARTWLSKEAYPVSAALD